MGPNPSQSVIVSTFGAMLCGVLLQQFLFGIIVMQTGRYYMIFHSRDPNFYLFLVGALLFLNTLQAVMDFHIIYRTAVVHYGQYDYFDLQTWTMWAEPGVTAVAGFFAQVFFVERCWRIMDRMWSVLALFTLLLLLSLGSGLAVSISFFKVMLFSKLAKIPIPIYFWLISTAFTDATIAAILILGLRRSMSSTPCKRTGNVCSRLILLTMETSAITALVAILNLIFYAAMKETAWHLLPQFSICRVYTLAVLVTLLARDDLRAALDSQTSPSFALSGTRQDRNVNCVKVTTVVENDAGAELEVDRKGAQADAKSSWTVNHAQ